MSSKSINDASRSIIDHSRVTLKHVESLVTYNHHLSLTIVIYNHNMFIAKATGADPIKNFGVNLQTLFLS